VFKHAACAPQVRASLAAMAGAAALIGFCSQAVAAEADEDEDIELEEVQVTGTRIQSPNVTSANPITSVTSEEMRQLGFVNVADALTMLVPQNISTYMPTMVGDDQAGFGGGGMEGIDRGSFFIGNTIANLRGLDPGFGSRTLTLVDGRRMPSTSSQAEVVDLNIIPSNLLQRMDVVTGGASATYGSGAMAGVVNLVLNNRMTGVNVDMDYGVNEAGDGSSPHLSVSGGMPFFGGKAHGLFGIEWQDQKAIRDCATARDWCAESRALLNNYTNFPGPQVDQTFTPTAGYEDYPARFQVANVRRSQFAPTGTLFYNNANVTSNLMFNENGTDLEEYALGFRGGTGNNAMNGDSYADGTSSPLATKFTAMRPSTERKSLFVNFEYNFTERTTGYVQANYAKTESLNRNPYTTGNYCVRFDTQGVAAQLGAVARAGDTINGYSGGQTNAVDYDTWASGQPTTPIVFPTQGSQWNNSNFRQWLGWSGGASGTTLNAPGFNPPYWVGENTPNGSGVYPDGATLTTPPTYTFANGTPIWIHVKNNPPAGRGWWVMVGIVLTADFEDPGLQATLPEMGRNANAFLAALSPEALNQVRSAFGTGSTHGAIVDQQTGTLLAGFPNTTGGGSGLDSIYGPSPCQGFTAMRKVWYPQLQQYTNQVQEPWRALVGVRGRFGGDWRWDAYYQYGSTDSTSRQNNVATNLRLAMATDAVIDDRVDSATYGQPVCRVVRDGIPVIDYQGRPLSELEALQELADGCQPINLFGSSYEDYNYFPGYDAALTQQQAIDYAFVESVSTGFNSLQTLSISTNGTLWNGWAGPLTGAFGLEVREDKVDNASTSDGASFYERADLARTWADGFGGKTRISEGFAELNMPLVVGLEAVNVLSVNLGARYASYYNKGGAGTTRQDATQNVFNWKASAVYEPFDFVRFRITRSRDLRAAGYRELFIQQPQLPDQFSGSNPWREYNAQSTEGRQERWGQVRVGNAELQPEKSDTLTLGLVLSPGGWAQGMRMSFDYYDIRVKDGISTPFSSSTTATIQSCWTGSGNQDPNPDDPDQVAANGNFDFDYYDPSLGIYPCREITFGTNADGTRNLQDIVNYNSARPQNSLPSQRRGVDVSWNYAFPMSRAFERVPGSMSLTVRATRAMESSGIQLQSGPFVTTCPGGELVSTGNCRTYVDLVGQIRSSVFIPGVAASPKWTGNIITGYSVGDLAMSLSARYIGGARLDKTWCDATQVECANYQNEAGAFLGGSVDDNWVEPYFNFALNGSYDLHVGNLKQFQVFGSVNNLLDKSPPFTGGGISGASSQYHDTMGRAYRFGVRMKF
jgi:outer membrane receptor protein involved in Fe transport